jgi:hypothetical protein
MLLLLLLLPGLAVAQSSFTRSFPLDTTGCLADGGRYCGPESCAAVNQDDVTRCVMTATTALDYASEMEALGCDATCTQARPPESPGGIPADLR